MLQQLDLTQDWDHHRHPRHGFTAWWTDSAGNAWPLPGPHNYEVGYRGAGPGALARAVTALATDAAARPDDPRTTLSEFEDVALRVLLVRRDWPTLIRRTVSNGDGRVVHLDDGLINFSGRVPAASCRAECRARGCSPGR